MTAILEVQGLAASYGKIAAVDGVRLTLPRGGVVTVVGPNGAGKTTLLNALMGIHGRGSSGRILFEGVPIEHLPAEARLERGLCLIAEKRELFASMTVEDNLQLGGFVRRGERGSALAEVYQRFPRLAERRGQLAGTLSGGERQMLAIGRALMSRPRVLMLDEPSLGLAPRIVAEMFRVVTDLKAAGVSILLVEQNARAALAVSDYGYVLELGSVALEGSSAALAADPRIIETYLGTSRGEDASIGATRTGSAP